MSETSLCKSVFQSGESTISTAEFTRRWIDFVSQWEQSRAAASPQNS